MKTFTIYLVLPKTTRKRTLRAYLGNPPRTFAPKRVRLAKAHNRHEAELIAQREGWTNWSWWKEGGKYA